MLPRLWQSSRLHSVPETCASPPWFTTLAELDASLLSSAEPFALGASSYLDAHPRGQEALPRIYVRFRPDGVERKRSFLALLDTGAHYCLLNAEVVDLLGDQLGDPIGAMKLRTVQGTLSGELYRHRIQLVAEVGRDLWVDATLFISSEWRGLNFLGYIGALDRVRFAVDPRANRFYFGPLD